MQRFKPFLEKTLNLDRVSQVVALRQLGVIPRHVPNPPEAFDEFEFETLFEGAANTGFAVATELGVIKRVMLGRFEPEEPDSFLPLSDIELVAFLDQYGDRLVAVFKFLTGL